jgi:hypothetical protein
MALRKKYNAWSRDLIGCDISWLKEWLELHFREGMTWQNYGRIWHIDHIRPCAVFDLTKVEEQEKCFHWTNLQPLFAKENIKKGAKIIGRQKRDNVKSV